jgi:CubicO group peptidase (beta-lactamase class C family)
LLSHTGGIADDYSLYPRWREFGRDEFLRLVLARPLAEEPGAKWRYSNDGYAMLARIVELASGRPFQQYMRQEVFAPAGLKRTGFAGDAWPAGQRQFWEARGPLG